MLFVISPAKTLDFTENGFKDHSVSPLIEESGKLIKILEKKSAKSIRELMGVSENIANLNEQRFKQFKFPFTLDNSKQAIYAFKGDVYIGLDADSFNKRDLNYAQKHLRILSGLYGILKPFDLMQPYRLEMGTKLKNRRGKNLYEFWGDRITDVLNNEFAEQKSTTLINLASNEYFKSINKKALNARIVNIAFKEDKNGQYKIVAFFAKKARGMMCHYAIKNKIKKVEDLKGFDYDGYAYNEDLSSDNDLVFTRISKTN